MTVSSNSTLQVFSLFFIGFVNCLKSQYFLSSKTVVFVYRELMILGYLDANTTNIDVERQRQQILDYASENGLTVDTFLQESKIESLKSGIKTDNHTLIFANIVVLGISLLQTYAFLRQHPELKPQNVRGKYCLRKLENKESSNA